MIVRLARFDKISEKILYRLASMIVGLCRPVIEDCQLIAEINMPLDAFDSKREQYLASRALGYMEKNIKCKPNEKILGVTKEDLYSLGLNFVFGQARSPGSSAVVSLHRLNPLFYGEAPNEELFLSRAVKEAVHELGHTFGLGHCEDPKCVMSFSNSVVDVDRKNPNFCENCQERLSSVV